MNKLYTLKNIEYHGVAEGFHAKCTCHDLKTEAIKHFNAIGDGSFKEIDGHEFTISEAFTTMQWIKHFFNLSDEDLE